MNKSFKMHLIILYGLSKCGKSTLGMNLAERLDYRFFEFDRLILEASAMIFKTIGKLRRNFGNAVYNRLEEDAMRNFMDWIMPLPQISGNILSLKIRTIDNPNTMRWLRNQGLKIYLRVNARILFYRSKKKEQKWEKFYNKYKKYDMLCNSIADCVCDIDDSPLIVNGQRLLLKIGQLTQ